MHAQLQSQVYFLTRGHYKSWILDFGLDHGLDYGPMIYQS